MMYYPNQELSHFIPNYNDVIDFIRDRHGDQKRIHGGPYYLHPIAVAEILLHEFGITQGNQLIAALCHDLLEDTQTTYEELVEKFGLEVADIVKALTKPKDLNIGQNMSLTPLTSDFKDKVQTKMEKSIAYYKTLRVAHYAARLIKLSDRIHNLSEMQYVDRAFQYKQIGDTVILMQSLKGYVDQWQFDKLQFAFWEAAAKLVG